jgi:hypothetical protein
MLAATRAERKYFSDFMPIAMQNRDKVSSLLIAKNRQYLDFRPQNALRQKKDRPFFRV